VATFFLDHCVWRETAVTLRRAGFSCILAKDLGRAEARNGDLLALATQRNIPLVTRDSDFTDLSRYPLGRHAGIVYLRILPETSMRVHHTLLTALREIDPAHLQGSLLTIEPDAYRLRRPA